MRSSFKSCLLSFFCSIFTPEVRENLIIEGPGNGIFGDLTAINIQRGRDHGLPGYIEFIEACGEQKPITFPQLLNFMPQSQIDRLKQVYTSPVDIDIFAGAISEKPVLGSQFGFTFTCILLEQFKNSRFGDRFWYERDDHEVAFNAEQLDAIRNVTMARVLCDNADDVTRIQPKAFVRRDTAANDDVLCDDIATVDLTPFKEMEGKFSRFSVIALKLNIPLSYLLFTKQPQFMMPFQKLEAFSFLSYSSAMQSVRRGDACFIPFLGKGIVSECTIAFCRPCYSCSPAYKTKLFGNVPGSIARLRLDFEILFIDLKSQRT